jgi:anti-anti-sigma factor
LDLVNPIFYHCDIEHVNRDNLQKFENEISKLRAKNSDTLVVDLEKVEYLCSEAIGVLLGKQRNFEAEGGEVVLMDLRSEVVKKLSLHGFNEVFRQVNSNS